jgi:tRNA (guanine-N7-)-methyltransferase
VDITSHLRAWEGLPRPWDAGAVFGRVAPLEVEIGSGKGLFLATAAAARPQHDFLGVEISRKYAEFAAQRLAKAGLSNARMLIADAARLLAEVLPDRAAAAVHVYFPDPWWKKRHHKRRILRPDVARHIERVLVPGGRLHFWTDVEEYFRWTLELLAQETSLEGPLDVPERPAAHDLDYQTHFERRMRLRGQPVYRSEFRRR